MVTKVTYNLLYVSNQLLESRLKLERAIVRYSKQNQETTVLPEEKPMIFPIVEKQNFVTPTLQVNRWILALTVIVLLFIFGIYFPIDLMASGAKVSKDLEIIEIHNLAGKNIINSVQLVRNSVHITA